jgi:cytochrome d ubiquinol oxidase subunit II
VAAAIVTGAIAIAGPFVLDHDAHRLYLRLLHDGWPLIAVSAVAGLAALVTAWRGNPRLVQPLGVLAVAALLAGWGTGQYPNLLGTHLSIREGAAPAATLDALVVVTVIFAALVGPSLLALYILTTRGRLQS